ncbi:MAG: hypothetical protein KatS3mg031_1076 [Chitinophagales bacterium]|nr:MAG: hypothetical protein KatS3mg031_1076 [Chitinophagales bacterium]
MRKKIGCLIIAITLLESNVHAQDLEYGVWAGIANYFGDLNYNASFEYIGPAGGFFFRYNLGTRFAFKQALSYGRVAFEDARSDFVYQQLRNLSFKSNIFEFSSHVEFHFFRYEKDRSRFSFTPYLLAGISVFYFDPRTDYQGNTYRLKPLQTEGKNYSSISLGIPVGGGFKYSFTYDWAIGIEGGYRKSFTDYLDDVSSVYPVQTGDGTLSGSLSDRSGEVTDPPIGFEGKQRGFAERFDDYLFIGIFISYSPRREKCPKPSKIP